jgi:hypothetical protein
MQRYIGILSTETSQPGSTASASSVDRLHGRSWDTRQKVYHIMEGSMEAWSLGSNRSPRRPLTRVSREPRPASLDPRATQRGRRGQDVAGREKPKARKSQKLKEEGPPFGETTARAALTERRLLNVDSRAATRRSTTRDEPTACRGTQG